MDVAQTELEGCLVFTPKVFGDQRGLFQELYHQERYQNAGLTQSFVQDNYSRSVKGTLRGLHYQVQNMQGKLVQVLRGEVFDVCVDLRPKSPTFGQHVSVMLSEENHQQFYIPPGFAHGFYVLSETAEFYYKCTSFYSPEYERTLLWNDEKLNINWPIEGEPILSEKDQKGVPLANIELPQMDY